MEESQKELLTVSEFARVAGVKPSFITQLINDERIPEAKRDPGDGRYRIPNRPCVMPPKYRRQQGKINDYYLPREQFWPEEEEQDKGSTRGQSKGSDKSGEGVPVVTRVGNELVIDLEALGDLEITIRGHRHTSRGR